MIAIIGIIIGIVVFAFGVIIAGGSLLMFLDYPSIVIVLGFDPTRTLVVSQVVLSFGLPFAIIPLAIFTARRDVMGVLVNRLVTTVLASTVAALIVVLNMYLLYQTFFGE